ncbi:MAG: hypothetical protein MI754_09560, partial [Chromatiales bacterium]|nr:hypothetical protein [Chromatiales bacterium]
CIMDPISVASYCSYAQPGKVLFRRFEPDIPLKVGILHPAESPKSLIAIKFADQLRARIEALEKEPEKLLAWGEER